MTTATTALAFVAPDEHPMIREAAGRLLDDHAGPSAARWAETHAALAAAGLLAAPMRDVEGAMDDARVAALIAEAIGERNIVSPFAVSAAVAARGLERAGWPAAAAGIGRRLAGGELVATIAWYEDDGLLLGTMAGTRLDPAAGGLVLTGCKRAVPFGAEAGLLLVPAMADGEQVLLGIGNGAEAAGAATGATGIEVASCGTIDGQPAADIRFDGFPVTAAAIISRGAQADALLAWMRDAWLAVNFADALGAMRRLVDMTGAYLGVRQQFGAAIGQNQALRHRFVDLHLAIREVEATCEYAAVAIDRADAAERARAVGIAHYATVRAAWRIAQECVQMHGGIGMAAETPVGGYFKRLLGLTLRCGDEDAALARLAAPGGVPVS